MGECANVRTLRLNEKTASYADVRAALNGYFAARRNTIVELARFNTRKQTPEESVGTFIQDLYLTVVPQCMLGPRVINESPSWLCETRSLVFFGLYYNK